MKKWVYTVRDWVPKSGKEEPAQEESARKEKTDPGPVLRKQNLINEVLDKYLTIKKCMNWWNIFSFGLFTRWIFINMSLRHIISLQISFFNHHHFYFYCSTNVWHIIQVLLLTKLLSQNLFKTLKIFFLLCKWHILSVTNQVNDRDEHVLEESCHVPIGERQRVKGPSFTHDPTPMVFPVENIICSCLKWMKHLLRKRWCYT